MPEFFGKFSSTEVWRQRADGPIEIRNRPLEGLRRDALNFTERYFNGSTGGRKQSVARILDRFLVGCEVIQRKDVVALKRRDQAFFLTYVKNISCSRPVPSGMWLGLGDAASE